MNTKSPDLGGLRIFQTTRANEKTIQLLYELSGALGVKQGAVFKLFTEATIQRTLEGLGESLPPSNRRLVVAIDLDNMSTDSSGLASVIVLHKFVEHCGGKFVVIATPGTHNREHLATTKIDTVLKVLDSQEDLDAFFVTPTSETPTQGR